jgi:hypothetical protein
MKGENPIIELNDLWERVRPFLVKFVSGLYGRIDGRVLEVGPFSGLAFDLAWRCVGDSFHMAVFPREILEPLRQEARALGVDDRVTVAESDESLAGVPANAFDLVLFRGAFFFPSFFRPDVAAIYRSLKAGGMALLGGGFGPHTPEEVIKAIEKRSKDLNQACGRVRITEEDVWSAIEAAGLREKATMITEGGLWVVLRKE